MYGRYIKFVKNYYFRFYFCFTVKLKISVIQALLSSKKEMQNNDFEKNINYKFTDINIILIT